MGWNSWDHFLCNIDETLIMQHASLIVSTGLAAHGYQYVNLDDCWALYRDSAGRVHPDPAKFPSGMFNLASYVHSLGLKIGIYSDAGNMTCAKRPGSLGHEVIDALTYAAWGIDFLKLDNCYSGTIPPQVRYPVMRDALNATGRPMVYSLCEWGVDDPATWAATVGNMWRTTGDINDSWNSFLNNLDLNDKWWKYVAAGGFGDPDMLNVGNGGKTYTEYVSEFSLWALIKAPLLLSLDLRVVTNESLSILTNDEVIAINQDPLAVQGHKITSMNGAEVWAGPLANGDVAVVLFNRNTTATDIMVMWSDIGLPSNTKANVRDLWKHADLGSFTGMFTGTSIPSHGTMTLRISPQQQKQTAVQMHSQSQPQSM